MWPGRKLWDTNLFLSFSSLFPWTSCSLCVLVWPFCLTTGSKATRPVGGHDWTLQNMSQIRISLMSWVSQVFCYSNRKLMNIFSTELRMNPSREGAMGVIVSAWVFVLGENFYHEPWWGYSHEAEFMLLTQHSTEKKLQRQGMVTGDFQMAGRWDVFTHLWRNTFNLVFKTVSKNHSQPTQQTWSLCHVTRKKKGGVSCSKSSVCVCVSSPFWSRM